MKKSARTFARTVTRTVALSVSMTVAVLFAVLQTHPSITRASSTRGFDVNDVSVLLPVGPNGLHPSIALRDLGVFDDDIFEQVLRFEYPAGTPDFPDFNDLPYVDSRFVTDIKRWKLTSFRIEDCSEVIHAERESHPNSPATFLITRDPGCQPRIRMVVQPSNLFGISLPTAIHILANLEPAEFQTAVQDLKALQDLSEAHYQTETFGKTLGLHPGLSSELTHPGKTALADHVRALILRALERNLQSQVMTADKRFPQTESITLILQTEINHWKFAGGLVRSGKWIKSETEFNRQFRQDPSYQAIGVEDLKCDIHSSCRLTPDPAATKLPLAPDGHTLATIFQDDLQFAQEQVPGRRSVKTLETAELVDLPAATHFFNTTCVSCHQSSNLRDPNSRVLPTQIPKGLTPFVEKSLASPFTNNIINFGYFGASAKVSTRTAAESLDVASRINQQQSWTNPAKEISDIEKFWSCIRSESDSRKCY